MKLEVRDSTIEMIKRYKDDIGITFPLKDADDVEILSDFFKDMECTMANALTYGDDVDMDLLDRAANAYDDLTPIEEDDYNDLDDLNRRLMS